jgi:hypothetical protein
MIEPTNWDAYYQRPAATARLTRPYTERWLIRTMAQLSMRPLDVIEFGGANSFCCLGIIKALPVRRYDVADFNSGGLRLFMQKMRGAEITHQAMMADLLSETPGLEKADVVFSVGLVEHFSPEGSRIVAARHFELVRPGGLVIITAPTPTFPYRFTRGWAERFGLWAFPDERPMAYEEVEGLGAGRGRVVTAQTLWPLILTQRAVAWRVS